MSLAVLEAPALAGPPADRRRFVRALADAATTHGAFYLADPPIPEALRVEAIEAARAFFALPDAEKAAVAIGRSPCFRGWSEMKGRRDFREQLHLGPEEPRPAQHAPYDALRGPNPWPPALGPRFHDAMLGLMTAAGALGRELLGALAEALCHPADALADAPGGVPYLLLKLIAYHPQPEGAPPRDGVAAHCDFSWLTILLQDDTGGLETRGADGAWIDAPPRPGAVFVNLGELAEVASGGRFVAAPHRVRNPSRAQQRLSLPIFVNPALGTRVAPLVPTVARAPDADHVHRVLPPGSPPEAFVFGEREWARKGLGRWCHDPRCLREP